MASRTMGCESCAGAGGSGDTLPWASPHFDIMWMNLIKSGSWCRPLCPLCLRQPTAASPSRACLSREQAWAEPAERRAGQRGTMVCWTPVQLHLRARSHRTEPCPGGGARVVFSHRTHTNALTPVIHAHAGFTPLSSHSPTLAQQKAHTAHVLSHSIPAHMLVTMTHT